MDCPNTSQTSSVASSLPDDPLVEILSRLPARSLCRCKGVSSAWRRLIAEPLHRGKLAQTLEGFFYEDGEADDGGHNSSPRPFHRHFIDPLGRSVRPPVDPSFPFLTNPPLPDGIQSATLLHSCNGLLLLGLGPDTYHARGYVVCNPATERWVAVPCSGWTPSPPEEEDEDDDFYVDDAEGEIEHAAYLVFDPARSSHFQLIQIVMEGSIMRQAKVHTYSSESGVWVDRTGERGRLEGQRLGAFGGVSTLTASALVNGMLHLVVSHIQKGREVIAAIDGEGKIRKVICWPENPGHPAPIAAFIGESQGLLHCITENLAPNYSIEISVWVLEDYDKEEWVLKHRANTLWLFGRMLCHALANFCVVAIHPHHNLIFIYQYWDQKLISYDMNSRKMRHLRTVGSGCRCIIPHIPYFGAFK